MRDHLNDFLASPGYKKLVRAGRGSVAQLANSLKDASQSPRSNSGGGSSNLTSGVMRNFRGSKSNSVLPSENKTLKLKELKHFILSEHNYIFGTYLEKFKKTNKMHFCQSTLRFKEANFPSDIERVKEAGLIFER